MFKGIGKRVLSLILCFAMVAALLPRVTLPAKAISAQEITGKTVDPSTLEAWQQYFGADAITTEYTGGVWTDKSVFKSLSDYLTADGISALMGPTAAVSGEVEQMLQTDPENFLVTMSAIAANQQITGFTTKPTDTVFVLDLSNSMDQQGYVPGMIDAANNAIKTLMAGNQHNRVGVILYSGSNSVNSSQGTGSATVVLPLDHYTSSNSAGTFLRYTGSNTDTAVYVASNVKNSSGQTVSENTGKTTNGGTYTQNGLYKAWQQFDALTAADTVIPAGQPQAGTKRTPAIVLMSDGQPTVGDTTYYDVGTSTVGDGSSPNTTNANRLTFLTQLTAAWVKAKMANKYGISNQEALIYTVGLNTSTNSYATDVLNPAASTNTTVADLWNSFVSATPDSWGRVDLNGWNTYKSADGMITSASQRVYPTEYFAADNTDGLAEAFSKIADTLTQKTPYVTLVEEGSQGSLDGYVTIEDKLGVLMDVKSVKGLVLGDRIFTGAELAKAMSTGEFGTTADPQAYGDELIRTIRERLGITDVSVAQNLARDAWQSGQLSYTSATEFSNYIGWYADADGNYLGHWEEADGYEGAGAPEGAAYINKSYGYLGSEAVGDFLGDMMHVVVMVHTEIATGDQSIVYKIPASLIPTVQYNVTLDGIDTTNPKSIERVAADPLRLLVEVGLRSEINTVNMEQKVAEYLANGGHIHENADGTYTFYTNRWGDGDGGEVNYDLPLTHVVTESHFHPALDNVRYYFVDDTLVYSDRNGTVYTGTAQPSGDGYYYARNYYELQNGVAEYITEYVPLTAVNAAKTIQGADGWYVPAGTPQQLTRFAAAKTDNATGTLNYSWNPVILHDDNGYNSYAFLGNNGTFTVAPAQGIALSKTVTEEVAGAPTEFFFTVVLSQEAPDLRVTDPEGNALTGIATVSGTQITVKLTKDQTVYLTGIPTGTTYTVTEEQTRYYAASAVGASGTVAAHTIHAVDFTNTPKGYGDLIISKDVTHPYDVAPQALTDKQFTIQVTLSGADVAGKTFQTTGLDGVTSVTTDAQGTFTVKLRDNESITLLDVPENTAFVAIEQLSSQNDKGFSLVRASSTLAGTVAKDQTAQIHVVNDYAPSEPVASITVSGTKTVTDETSSFDWTGKSFSFKLEQYHPETGAYTQLGETVTVTQQGGTYTFADAIRLNAIGTYYYKVSEIIPGDTDRISGMSYDATAGRFVVEVTDNDVDGHLEFTIRDYTTGQEITGSNNVFTFTKNFVNTYAAKSTYVEFTVDKTITDPHNIGTGEAGFLFGLYEVSGGVTATTPAYTMRTVLVEGTDGKAVFHIPLTKEGTTTYILKEIIPADSEKIPGMVYSTEEYTVEITAEDVNGELVGSVAFRKDGTPVQADELVITNEMKLHSASAQWAVEKILDGITPPSAEDFSFTLTETDGSFTTAKVGGLQETVTVSGAGTDRFSNIVYTQVGTYYYVVKEEAGSRGGMTYDATVYHVTVTVTVQGDDLVADTVITKLGGGAATELVFTNTYALTGSVNADIAGTKTLTGRALRTGEFTFELRKGGSLVESVTNLHDGSFAFTTLTFGPEDLGTHTYTVTEKIPDGAVNNKYKGVTYTTKSYTVEITVSDNGAGGLNIVKKIDGSENGTITFENVYKTGTTTARITGTKTWYNEDTKQNISLNGNEFTFGLYRSNEDFSTQGSLVKEVKNGAGGTISLSLTYDEPGDHYYILREIAGASETTAYDNTRYFIRVLVSDDGEGNLNNTVTVTRGGSGSSDVEFTNRYIPQPVTATIEGTKNLTGRDIVEGEFIFELWDEPVENRLATAENVGNTFTFDAIEYENTGVYTYKVIERIPDPSGVYKGVTYDTAIHTVKVTVTDESGILKATVAYPDTGLVFNNTYAGASTNFTISGEKKYDNLTAGQFTFELVDKDGVHIATAHNDANGEFTFTNIPLAAVGDYTFYVREVKPDGAVNNKLDGITYDATEYKVTVSVVDDTLQGKLVASTPVVEDGPIVFTNTYSVEPVTATIRANKVLEGRTLKAGEFTFELYEGNSVIQTATNKADGTVEFQGIEYSQAGEKTYTIREKLPDDAVDNKKDGITYDTQSHTVYVNVTDNGDGTLSADVVYENGNPTFRNTYAVTGATQFTVGGTKVLENRNSSVATDRFTFELRDANGDLVKSVESGIGSFTFEPVMLNTLGTHIFTVTEKTPDDAVNGVKNGITYSTQVYTVEVTVRDNGVGGMVAGTPIISYNGTDVAAMVFTNTYAVTEGTKTDIVGIKTLTGNKTLEPGMFTFELYAGTDTTAEPIAVVTNGTGGVIEFKDVPLNELGINTFTVKERTPEGGKLDGITYSALTYTVTVETTDNDMGGMTAGDPVYYLGQVAQPKMEFINSYAVEGEVPARIEGKKALEGGKKLNENDFTFELYEGEQVTGDPIALAQNAEAGGFGFDVSFRAPGAYTYTVRELAPDGYYGDNIRYSQAVYRVTIQVDDNGKGGMTVHAPVYELVSEQGKQTVEVMEFVNEYIPDEVPFALEIQKTVKVNSGKGVSPKGFKFQVWHEGTVIQELTSDEEGKAKLDLIAGPEDIGVVVELKVTEVNTKIKGVTYSTVEHKIRIAIGQNDDGTIKLDLTVNDKAVDKLAVEFVNTYDKSVTPNTGDEFSIGLFIGLMATSAIGLAALLLAKKKKMIAE